MAAENCVHSSTFLSKTLWSHQIWQEGVSPFFGCLFSFGYDASCHSLPNFLLFDSYFVLFCSFLRWRVYCAVRGTFLSRDLVRHVWEYWLVPYLMPGCLHWGRATVKMRLKHWLRRCSIKFILLGKGTTVWLYSVFYPDMSIGLAICHVGVLM